MFKDKIIVVNLVIMAALLSCIFYFILSAVIENNVEMVYDTTHAVKTQQTASVKLTEGFDRRVQVSVPAWALESQYFDDVKLQVK